MLHLLMMLMFNYEKIAAFALPCLPNAPGWYNKVLDGQELGFRGIGRARVYREWVEWGIYAWKNEGEFRY